MFISVVIATLATALLPLAPIQDNKLTAAEVKDGFVLLFDGKSLDNWMTSDEKPSKRPIEEGAINPHKSGHYMLVHKKKWKNYVLRLDFKISKGCNSGIFFRTHSLTPRPGKDVGFNGLEVAIDDTTTAGYHDTGAIYDLVKPTENAMKPVGEWNSFELMQKDGRVIITLNGKKVTDADLNEFKLPLKRPDGSDHKFDFAIADHPLVGYIGLQDHGSDCWYKNIRIRELL